MGPKGSKVIFIMKRACINKYKQNKFKREIWVYLVFLVYQALVDSQEHLVKEVHLAMMGLFR